MHITSAVVTSDFTDQPPTVAEQAYLDTRDAYDVNDQGYSEIMSTRPDTIAAALADSPAGLLAWIIDKYRDWSDCGGDLESRWDRETLLTVATLYWVTQSIGTSFQQYYNYELNEPVPQIQCPPQSRSATSPRTRTYPRSLADESSPTCAIGAPRIAAGISWPTKSRNRSRGSSERSSRRCDNQLQAASNPDSDETPSAL